MQLVSGKDLFDEARFYHTGTNGKERDLDKAEHLYNLVLNHNRANPLILCALGTLHMEKENYGLAIQLLTDTTILAPDFGDGWNNLAQAYRRVQEFDKAAESLHRAVQAAPGVGMFWANLAGCYVNHDTPLRVVEYADRALALNPNDKSAMWNKAMALLELGRFEEAWDLHEVRIGDALERNVAARNYHGPDGVTPKWDGRTGEIDGRRARVVIHGEQGLGDEIMFASCIPDAMATGAKLLVECAPRLEAMLARAFPDVTVHGTHETDGREWIEKSGKPDFMCGLGSLPMYFRRSQDSFPRTPYLKPDGLRMVEYIARLPTQKRPRIGITWQGGVDATRGRERSVFLPQLWPLLRQDATFVSFNYTPDSQRETDQFFSETGVRVHHMHDVVGAGEDLDKTLNLMAGMDLLITVSQTALHIGGAAGIPTWVLVPYRPDWRLGVDGERMFWYGDHLKLYRQIGPDWTPLIERMAGDLEQWLAGWSNQEMAA